ncbi:MAG: DUF2306 domain-containing protein [Rhizobiaceae bacterium]|nr:DUF2306 domain-containing protein [Rhizobiaceae bacterium]
MSLEPLFNAGIAIQIHAMAASISFLLGPFILFRKKGDARHKILGRLWAFTMAMTIASSFFIFGIRTFGLFGPIHIISVLASFSLVRAIHFARIGNIVAHQRNMRGLYFGALIVAGLFTFLPNRIMSEVFFNGRELSGFLMVSAGVVISYGALGLAKRQGWIKADVF